MDHREQLPVGAELVGVYRINGVLGHGGFGVTYTATDLALDKTVAIKEYFPTEFATRDDTLTIRPKSERHSEMFEWGRKRFLDEAQTLAKFRHSAIVRVHRFFEALNTAYMVLEFEDGQSLRHWLDGLDRPANQSELDAIVPPLLDALTEMHAADFIHRDIAPDNIIIRPDGSPVLLDFGAARQAIAAETKTLTGIVKSGYSPPEQYLTDASLQGPWTDIYALGATLYRVVTGAAPSEAPARQMNETCLPAASASQGEYRLAFLEALDWALKLKIEERPQSVLTFRDALSGAQEVSEKVAPPEAVGGNQRVSKIAPMSPTPRPRQRARASGLKWAVAALIVIVGSIGGYIAYDNTQAERKSVQALANAKAARVARLAREAKEAKRKAEADRKKRADDIANCNQSRDIERRIRVCTRLLEAGRLSKTERAIAYARRGSAYDDKGQIDRAIADFTKAIQLDTRYAFAYHNRGISHHKRGQYDRAIADYGKAIQINPRDATAYTNRGITYRKQGQFDRAITDFTKAIQLNPRLEYAVANRGLAYYQKGDRDKAIADYDMAIQINPRDVDAYTNRGLAYVLNGQLDRAIADYDMAIQINPRYAFAYNNLGVTYFMKGQYDHAIADFTKAIKINPRDADAFTSPGVTYYMKGEYDRAITDFTKAIRINPRDTFAYTTRGLGHDQKGDRDKAIADYRKALQIDPSHQHAKANLKALGIRP